MIFDITEKAMKRLLAGLALAAVAVTGAQAAGGYTKELKHHHWHFTGVFGQYDKDAVQRGYQVYREVCAQCHSMRLVSFRNLGQPGGPFYLDSCPAGVPANVDCANPNENPIVKALAAEYEIEDGPDDSGDYFKRPGVPSDRFPNPYSPDMKQNNVLATSANNGALPPDLSLIAKARPHGPDYIYSLLTGYVDPPETISVSPGQYYNPYFPGDSKSLIKDEYKDKGGNLLPDVKVPYGGAFAMAPPLLDGAIDYADESTPETVEQYSADVTEFLMWAAEPKLEARKKLGFMVVSYLLIFTGLLYWSYRKVWSNIEH